MNATIDKAYCEELKKIVTIIEAEAAYKLSKNKKRFVFRCANDECRAEKNPLISAVNYDKDEKDRKKAIHFSRLSSYAHIDKCTSCQVTHNDSSTFAKNHKEIKTEYPFKYKDIIHEFIFDKKKESLVIDNKVKNNLQPNAYSKNSFDTSKRYAFSAHRTTSSFHTLASQYYQLRLAERLDEKLIFNGKKLTYRKHFKEINQYIDSTENAIYKTFAWVNKVERGMFINFKNHIIGKKRYRTLYIFIPSDQDEKNKKYILETAKEANEKKRDVLVSMLNPKLKIKGEDTENKYGRFIVEFENIHLSILEKDYDDL